MFSRCPAHEFREKPKKKEKEVAYVNLKYQKYFLLKFSWMIVYCLFLKINHCDNFFKFAVELLD
jgi:hypothetical protein